MTRIILLCAAAFVVSCQNTSSGVWEDTKTASRYLQRRGKALFGKSSESRMIADADEFYGPKEEEFIPLREEDLKAHIAVPQSTAVPGEGKIPGIEMFIKPSGDLAAMFRNLHFNTDEHVVREDSDIQCLKRMATFLKRNPHTYLFIEGHCDERASEAYNLALGTRRSNYIREYLVKSGVNKDQIFTTSYGKERPLDCGHNRMAWKTNRRVEFKLHKVTK